MIKFDIPEVKMDYEHIRREDGEIFGAMELSLSGRETTLSYRIGKLHVGCGDGGCRQPSDE
jgi:hypothetical protein